MKDMLHTKRNSQSSRRILTVTGQEKQKKGAMDNRGLQKRRG
jgi:hypothetical protein